MPEVAEPVLYAKLHDNGNFVLYGSNSQIVWQSFDYPTDTDSQIVWQSFDYPTDTLLGGQKLKLGVDHLVSNSGKYKLSMRNTDGAVMIYNVYDEFHARLTGKPLDRPETMLVTLNLNTAGILYLVNSDGKIREIIYNGKKQHQQLKEGTINNVKQDYIYIATLDSEGDFVLYRERIDGNVGDNEDSSSGLIQLWTSNQWDKCHTPI
ncbi:epidermis-specific secreted glycoprotein EP1-like [Papaver somniferum]|uniref:epidermis-specific secreted glycoprotein EP1-like n=1 Tax=Papaver somniferum TaxID=3469 RepID=UPI000E6FA34D|nr:epidermis-specific secreted glycoprotein EP1-like [Papaver somniferum]